MPPALMLLDPEQRIALPPPTGAKSPREVALRTTTRDGECEVLVATSGGKVFLYRGRREPIPEEKRTDFERQRGISERTFVRRLAYFDWKRRVDPSSLPLLFDKLDEHGLLSPFG